MMIFRRRALHSSVKMRALPWSAVCALILGAVLVRAPTVESRVGIPAPEILNETWLNGPPQRLAALRGNVVLVEFWTFGCYNCRNVEPQVKEWHGRYRDKGLVIIGVHSPEFAYEKSLESVQRYILEQHIAYSITIDNDFMTWNRYGNRYWPAMYLIDKHGVIRYVRVGEGGYQETEHMIESLLAEAR